MYVHTLWTRLKYVLPIQLYTCIHVCTQTCMNVSTYICTCMYKLCRAIYFNTFQHTAKHCDTLRHTAIFYSTQFLASVCTYSSQLCVCVCAFVFFCSCVRLGVCFFMCICIRFCVRVCVSMRVWATHSILIFFCVCEQQTHCSFLVVSVCLRRYLYIYMYVYVYVFVVCV